MSLIELDELGPVLSRVESRLREVAAEAPEPVRSVALHQLIAGGKRLRPRIVVLTSRLNGCEPESVINLAAAAELVHNASLLHDDVIDEAPTRRGRDAARTVWGNAHSVLAGDHLMACALELLEASEVDRVLPSMLATMRRLVTGEVVQLAHRGKLIKDMDSYYRVIRGKTAALFSWCADAGARAGGADEATCGALAEYGEEVGVAFQLCDDLLDLSGAPEKLGKSLMTDLRQGVATLPVVLAAEREPALVGLLEADREPGELAAMAAQVQTWVEETGAASQTRLLAGEHIDRARAALAPLTDRAVSGLLDELARGLLDRKT